MVAMAVLLGVIFIGISIVAFAYAVVPSVGGYPSVISLVAGRRVRRRVDPPRRLPRRDDADPVPRREHVVQRVPAPRRAPRDRRLHAPPVRVPRRPPGVLVGHRAAGRRRRRSRRRCSAARRRCSSRCTPSGVFVCFSLSQAGMVRHWLRLRDARLAAPAGDQRLRRDRHDGRPRDRRLREVLRRGLPRRDPHPDPRRDDAVHPSPVPGLGRAARDRPGRRHPGAAARGPRDRAGRGHQPGVVQAVNIGRSIGAGRPRRDGLRRWPGRAWRCARSGSGGSRTSRSTSSRPRCRSSSSRSSPTSTGSTRQAPAGKPAPMTFVIVPEFVPRHWWERGALQPVREARSAPR